MARKSETSAAQRIESLAVARKRVKSILGRGEELALGDMCRLLGITPPTMKKWIAEIPGFAQSGAFDAGSEGREYSFKPLRTIDYLTRHFERVKKAQAEVTVRLARLAGAEDLIDPERPMSLDDIEKALRSLDRIEERRERQGELIDAAATASVFRAYHQAIQKTALGLAQQADPEGRWSPEFRRTFDDAARSLLLGIQRAGRDALKQLSGSAGQTTG